MANNNRLQQNLRVDLNISPELERLIRNNADVAPQAFKLGLRSITKQGSKEIKDRISSLGLVKSGKYAKSVRGTTTNSKSVISSKLFYAKFIEDGAKTHTIKPKAKNGRKALYINGVWVKRVTHPGVKAYHVFDDTWNQMETSGEVKSLFSAGVTAAIQGVQNGTRS